MPAGVLSVPARQQYRFAGGRQRTTSEAERRADRRRVDRRLLPKCHSDE